MEDGRISEYYEDEINLIDYLRVLWKWKWLIIAGTLICAIATAAISLQMPKIYEISTVIEPGILGVNDNGSFIYIDSVGNISGKVNEGAYNRKIEETFHLDPLKTEVKFKPVIPKSTNVIKVTSQWEEKDTDLGMKVIGHLLHLLSNDYGKIVEQKKGDCDRYILIKRNEISKLEIQRKSLKGTLKNIRWRTNNLEKKKKVNDIKNNTEDMITQRDLLLEKGKPEVQMPLLLYSTAIQQNISYLDQISNRICDFKEKEEAAQQEIKSLEKDIDTAKIEIAALNAKKGLIGNIKVIQKPEISLHPVKPKKKLIVLVSGVVSLFFFVLLAFFIEYIKNASKNGADQKGK